MKINKRKFLKSTTLFAGSFPFIGIKGFSSENNCQIPDDHVFIKVYFLKERLTIYLNYFDFSPIGINKINPNILLNKADYVFQDIDTDETRIKVCLKAKWLNVPKDELDGRCVCQFGIKHFGGNFSGGMVGFAGDVKFQQRQVAERYRRGNV